MKWFNQSKTLMVQTEAIEFYLFNSEHSLLQISMYGSIQYIHGDEAVELYRILANEE